MGKAGRLITLNRNLTGATVYGNSRIGKLNPETVAPTEFKLVAWLNHALSLLSSYLHPPYYCSYHLVYFLNIITII
jgi:hypothetical protein